MKMALKIIKPMTKLLLCLAGYGQWLVLIVVREKYCWLVGSFFFEIIQYNSDTHNSRTLTHPYTQYNSDTHNSRTLTHPYEYTYAKPTLWASSKTEPANPRDWRSHHRRLAVDGNVAYHLMHNAVKSQNIRSHGKSNPGPQVLLMLL